MRAISLHQPYASLVAIGAKRWETRSRRVNWRGALAIHAAQKWTEEMIWASIHHPFSTELEKAGLDTLELPHGAIIAVCQITGCITTTEWLRDHCKTPYSRRDDIEYCFGDYGPNRFAWKLEKIIRLKTPVHCKGRQFFWELPKEVEEAIAMQLLEEVEAAYPENIPTEPQK